MVHQREMVDLHLLHILVSDMQIIDSQRFVNKIIVEMLGLGKTKSAQDD